MFFTHYQLFLLACKLGLNNIISNARSISVCSSHPIYHCLHHSSTLHSSLTIYSHSLLTMRTAVDDKKRPRGSSHHLSSHKVIVHQPKHISFSKKGRTSQYQTKKDLREVIYDLFNDYCYGIAAYLPDYPYGSVLNYQGSRLGR